jgi:peptidyl-prolyl cis-trans isomerase C
MEREQTPTPQPLAARVNGEGITLAEYQAELARYQQAAGKDLADADRQRVLDDLINQELLAQAAAENGFTLDETALQERLDKLASQLGSPQALADWMKTNGYSEAEFRQQLARSVRAAWMRDQILAKLPTTAEQMHARQILLRTAEDANQALAKLQAGQDFNTLAKEADPITNGELGWFPRGFLFFPELEEAAFKLEPGQYSNVIQTPSGFHILYVIERAAQRTLDPQAHLILQEKALQTWLDERRQQSQIEVISP